VSVASGQEEAIRAAKVHGSDAAQLHILSQRDSAMVAWHEVPGKAPHKRTVP
jgi:hypothetical protein